jgi:tetratricopeptide (TPR) repeat protein
MSGESPQPDPLRSRLLAAWNQGWLEGPPVPDSPTLAALRQAAASQPDRLAALFGGDALPGVAIEDMVAADDPWQVGDALGGTYRIEAWHEGGFARVALCRHLPSGHGFALKSPRRHLLRNPAAVESFSAEARRWIQIGAHPHVVQAYGIERLAGRLFLALEWVPGALTVADLIVRGESGWSLALRVGAQVASALAHAEQRLQLIHGDIKPANILHAPHGTFKLTDFGISFAALAEPADLERHSHTRGYVGPDFSTTETPRTTATDMYAFGVTLWQCVTGLPASQHGGVSPLPPDVPAPLTGLIRDCVQSQPSARPASFLELARRLADLHVRLLGTPPAAGYLPIGTGFLRDREDAARQAANLGLSARELGRFAEAEAAARRAVELDPSYAAGHDVLGCTLLDLSREEEAAGAFEAACALAPGDIAARLHLARAKFLVGQMEDARVELAFALTSVDAPGGDPRSLGIDSGIIAKLLPAGDAVAWLRRIVAADPGALATWINLTALLRALNEDDAALGCAKHAVNIHPGSALAWGALSGALLDKALEAEALEAAERAIALLPDNPELHGQHVAALARCGQTVEAAEQLRAALQRWPDSNSLRALGRRPPGY